MTVPRIENLRRERWANLSVQERMQALQDLENALADQDRRTRCTVKFITDDMYETPDNYQLTRGDHNDEVIYINEALVNPNTGHRVIYKNNGEFVNPAEPYMATETLFHEDRHDAQDHIATQSNTVYDPKYVRDLQMNLNEGYLTTSKDGYIYYRWQLVEKDANEVARQRTKELFADEFKDPLYSRHDQNMDEETSEDLSLVTTLLGNNYEEKVHQKMVNEYKRLKSEMEIKKEDHSAAQSEAKKTTESEALRTDHVPREEIATPAEAKNAPSMLSTTKTEDQDRGVSGEQTGGNPSNESSTEAENGEDYDYSRGYGL